MFIIAWKRVKLFFSLSHSLLKDDENDDSSMTKLDPLSPWAPSCLVGEKWWKFLRISCWQSCATSSTTTIVLREYSLSNYSDYFSLFDSINFKFSDWWNKFRKNPIFHDLTPKCGSSRIKPNQIQNNFHWIFRLFFAVLNQSNGKFFDWIKQIPNLT